MEEKILKEEKNEDFGKMVSLEQPCQLAHKPLLLDSCVLAWLLSFGKT